MAMIELAKARGRMSWRILLALAAVAAVFLSAYVGEAEATADEEMSSVNVFYFVPSDQVPDSEVFDAIPGVMSEVQAWYARELGGQTFSFSAPLLVMGQHPAEFYNQAWVWGSVIYELDARRLAPDVCSGPILGRGPYGINLIVTHISIPVNGGTPCGGMTGPLGNWWYAADGGGQVMFSEDALDAYLGRPRTDPRQNTGQIAQELGHAFTLPHPPFCEIDSSASDCAIAVMWSAHNWPDGVLLDRPDATEKATLWAHPLMDTVLDISGSEPTPTPPGRHRENV